MSDYAMHTGIDLATHPFAQTETIQNCNDADAAFNLLLQDRARANQFHAFRDAAGNRKLIDYLKLVLLQVSAIPRRSCHFCEHRNPIVKAVPVAPQQETSKSERAENGIPSTPYYPHYQA